MRKIPIALLAIFFCSCVTYKGSYITKGTFEVMKPPNIYGNERHLSEGKHRAFSLEATFGENSTIPLPSGEVEVNGSAQDFQADMNYRLIHTTGGFQYYGTSKKRNNMYLGSGFGFQNFPYGFFDMGYNGKFAELGAALTLGFASLDHNISGVKIYDDDGDDYSESFSKEDGEFTFNWSAALHASVYYKRFALSYAGSVAFVRNDTFNDRDFLDFSSERDEYSFNFPALFMQDIGVAYTNNHIKMRLGLNQIIGDFKGQHYGLSSQLAYIW